VIRSLRLWAVLQTAIAGAFVAIGILGTDLSREARWGSVALGGVLAIGAARAFMIWVRRDAGRRAGRGDP
jgi:hypothetical protein